MYKTKRQKEFWWDIAVVALTLILLLLLAVNCNSAVEADTVYESQIVYAGDTHMTTSNGDWLAIFYVPNGKRQSLYMNGRYIGGSNVQFNEGVITINLSSSLTLSDIEAPVKIQGFSYEDMKFRTTFSNMPVIYEGNELEIKTGYYNYFIIRMEVVSDK